MTSVPCRTRLCAFMSWNSIGKQSVEVRTSSPLISSGAGFPCSRHQRNTGSDSPSSCAEILSSTQSTFKSEAFAFQSPTAPEPYSTAEISRSPKVFFKRSTRLLSCCSMQSLRRCHRYQLLEAPPPPKPPPPKPPNPPPPPPRPESYPPKPPPPQPLEPRPIMLPSRRPVRSPPPLPRPPRPPRPSSQKSTKMPRIISGMGMPPECRSTG